MLSILLPVSVADPVFPEVLGVDLLLADSFLGQFFAQINKVPDPSITVTCWGIDERLRFSLFYPSSSSSSISLDRIKHQLLHLLLEHPLRMAQYGDATLFQLAADLEVQQYLPIGEQSEALSKMAQLLKIAPSVRVGLDDIYTALAPFSSSEEFLLLMASHRPYFLEHHLWPSIAHYSRQEQLVIRAKLRRLIRHYLEKHLPKDTTLRRQGLIEQLRQQIASPPSSIRWQQQLRQFVSGSGNSRRHTSLRRPSRRYCTWPGSRRKRRQHLIVAIDTSASLKTAVIHRFFQQIHQVWKAGTMLTIIECDDQVRRHYTYQGKAPENISGRGNTQFSPALQYASKHFKFDGLIYFTDGYGLPFHLSFDYPLLWLISPEGIKRSHQNWNKLPGSVVKML